MTFTAFPTTPGPDYPFKMAKSRKIKRIRFNDGSEQRFPIGINNDDRKVDLKWSNLTEAEVAILEGFLDGLEGYTPFSWTMPGTSTSFNWICSEYGPEIVSPTYYNFYATFERVYDV